jgi:EAL domain-containing protein (putative c-di-GMP-specific phosphodiesterase class I)
MSRHKDAQRALQVSVGKDREIMSLLTNAIESMSDGFILADAENRLVMCNERFRDIHPDTADRLEPGVSLDGILAELGDESQKITAVAGSGGHGQALALAQPLGRATVEPVSGSRWIETRDRLMEDGHRVGIRIDATERVRAEEALASSERRYRSLFDAAPISMWEGDWSEVKKFVDELTENGKKDLSTIFSQQPDRLVEAADRVRVLDVNKSTLKLYEAEDKAAFMREHQRRLSRAPWATFQEQVESLADGQLHVVSESGDVRSSGSRFRVRVTLALPEEHRLDWRRVFAAVEDVTEARALSRQLRYQATHGALTGLVNRREFEERLKGALKSASEEHAEHALCYLDLDQFKIINDTSGHVAGDELLRRLGHELAKQVKRRDTLARLGGDEIGVLLEYCSMNAAGRLVEPDAFLPAAERYGLSVRIDQWVVHEAFRQLSRDPEHLNGLSFCSINLSGVSLSDENFLVFVVSELAARKIPPEKICFEVTETAAIGNLAGATRFIGTLGRVGCRFALDDFGSGLSSFAYLKTLPVDFLKIDGFFVKDIVDDSIDRELVRSINKIGHVMGKKTIAEFVEDEKILKILEEIGVDYVQGFALGKPRLIKKN